MCGKIILLSGGLDSYISYRLFATDYHPVFVDTGAKYAALDYAAAQALVPNLQYLKMPTLTEHYSGMVPHRNLILLALVANKFDCCEIMVSAPKGELVSDQQPAFYRKVSKLLGITVSNPAGRYTKSGLIRQALARGVTATELLQTRSCYSDSTVPCGECSACIKRAIAFGNSNLALGWTYQRTGVAKLLSQMSLRLILRHGFSATLDTLRFFRKNR